MSNKSGVSSQIISIPKGGGALQGIGETFSPDLHTGTGNFSFPIALPPGRNGFQPHLNLAYSTGNGNGYFGLGWNISMPGVNRKTSQGIPRYNDNSDTFVLSGAEDLVAVAVEKTKLSAELKTRTSYRPRTEGLFAHIDHYYIVHKPASGQNYRVEDYWQVCSKDGLISYYGTPEKFRQYPNDVDKAALLKPGLSQDVFAWKLSRTVDTFGNWIEYSYLADSGNKGARQWNQPLLNQICYTNYTDKAGQPQFLVTVTFTYEDRPDTSSEYRAGFEICTSQRCREITIETHANQDYKVRTYQLHYERDRMNGTSLLHKVQVVGYGDDGKPDEGNGLPDRKSVV